MWPFEFDILIKILAILWQIVKQIIFLLTFCILGLHHPVCGGEDTWSHVWPVTVFGAKEVFDVCKRLKHNALQHNSFFALLQIYGKTLWPRVTAPHFFRWQKFCRTFCSWATPLGSMLFCLVFSEGARYACTLGYWKMTALRSGCASKLSSDLDAESVTIFSNRSVRRTCG